MPGIDLPFAIGGETWPGLSKLIEEAGEVLQIAGKLIATGGESAHWDGSDLGLRMCEELGDLMAACEFVALHNFPDLIAVSARREVKLDLFEQWQDEQSLRGGV